MERNVKRMKWKSSGLIPDWYEQMAQRKRNWKTQKKDTKKKNLESKGKKKIRLSVEEETSMEKKKS